MKKRAFKSNINADKHEKMVASRSEEAKQSLGIVNTVLLLDCDDIDTWCYRDRMDFELGDIDELGASIKSKGQAQPIIVVETSKEFVGKNTKDSKYIVIAGYRRWMACKKLGIKIQAIISKMTFQEAVSCLMAENEKEDVSDYSKGMFFSSIINSENITQDDLHKKLNISITSINRYLSFSRVPIEIWNAVSDMSKVTSRTAAEIASMCKKGQEYVDAIVSLADQIRNGVGAKRITALVDKLLADTSPKELDVVVIKKNGKVFGKVSDTGVHFSKAIRKNKNFNELKADIISKIESIL